MFTKIDFLIVSHFHCYVNVDPLCLFAANVFSNPNISKLVRAQWLKFLKDREDNDLTKIFQKNAKVSALRICN